VGPDPHQAPPDAVAYADDGYIKAKLSVALEVLSDVKHALKEYAGLDPNFDKTMILVKGISAADAHAAAQHMINVPRAPQSPALSRVFCGGRLHWPWCSHRH
jgi:hypothetical protein